MGRSSEDMGWSAPNCPKCDRPMVRRTARRGPNAGSEFWGCSEFPKCRGIVQDEPPANESTSRRASLPDQSMDFSDDAATGSDFEADSGGFLTRVAKAVDKGWRWYLESDEPDATGRWDDARRRRMLSYVHNRDGGRCGLCAGEMKLKGAQIEHVVPKVFAVFDVCEGKAEPGTRYKSRLHRIDNLQAAHTYCNKRKGNAPEVSKWRHPAMPPLPVADAEDGKAFVLPWKRAARSGR